MHRTVLFIITLTCITDTLQRAIEESLLLTSLANGQKTLFPFTSSTASFPTATRHTESPPVFTTWTSVKPTVSSIRRHVAVETDVNPHVTDWSDVDEEHFLRHHYLGEFSSLNAPLCQGRRNLKLVILVTSAIAHFSQRTSVRMTWGHYGHRDDIAMAFVIGDGLLTSYNSSVQEMLAEEMALYNDFVVPHFDDSYRNLTLKTLHMMDWVSTYCSNAKYYLKTDDDVFLNVPHILRLIDEISLDDKKYPKIYGHIFSGHYPQRDTSHKHHLTYDVYPHNLTYPNFTSGPAYLMSAGIVRPLFDEALNIPFLNLEDVLVTGFAAMNLGIPRVDLPGFINEIKNPVELTACELIDIYAGMTDGSTIQMQYTWYNYLMGSTLCIWKSTANKSPL